MLPNARDKLVTLEQLKKAAKALYEKAGANVSAELQAQLKTVLDEIVSERAGIETNLADLLQSIIDFEDALIKGFNENTETIKDFINTAPENAETIKAELDEVVQAVLDYKNARDALPEQTLNNIENELQTIREEMQEQGGATQTLLNDMETRINNRMDKLLDELEARLNA